MKPMRFFGSLACVLVFSSCASHNSPATSPAQSSVGPAAASYTPRVGVAVTTGSRTCVAIQNANLTTGAPLTLVSPLSPQMFAQAEVSNLSSAPCPITKDVDPGVTSYDLRFSQTSTLPKLTPLIAVTNSSAAFSVGNNSNVVANLDQDNKTESFRACSSADGEHVTVWSGNALDGTVLWHGYYYEPGNAGTGPACTPKEVGVAG